MDTWQRILKHSLKTPEEVALRFDLDVAKVKEISQNFKAQITPYYADLIKCKNDPLYRQVVPDSNELMENGGVSDPLGEEEDSPVPSIVHRYPDRLIFLVTHLCASYCRFCTRKRRVGDQSRINPQYIENGLEYIRNHRMIRDVIISGGDPLILSDSKLEYILQSIREIPHVEIIRIGTRIPCFLPRRITPQLASMLRRYHPLYVNVHFNHPDEITEDATQALSHLADAGIPLGNQSVLLRGVNDHPLVMKRLVQQLLKVRVKPYYIYQADLVSGTEHLRTTIEKGLEIMDALRGWTSGLGIPYFVIDAPGGGGKIPVLPAYLQSLDNKKAIMRNYAEHSFVYPQIPIQGRKRLDMGLFNNIKPFSKHKFICSSKGGSNERKYDASCSTIG